MADTTPQKFKVTVTGTGMKIDQKWLSSTTTFLPEGGPSTARLGGCGSFNTTT
jgi:hypothetical protein